MDTLELTSCTVDLRRGRVARGQTSTTLTSQEIDILRYLCARPDQTVSRDELSREILGQSPNARSRAIDAAVGRLRTKIEADPSEPDHVLTVRGVGYRYLGPARIPETSWVPAGVAPAGATAAALLGRARQAAEARGDGFVGIEHLLQSIETAPPVQVAAILRGDRFGKRLAQLTAARDDRNPSWTGTPRLQECASRLSGGFEVADLWRALLEDPWRGIHGLDGEFVAPEDSPDEWGHARAGGLQVVGGPEDGRQLTPAAGERIGRWWPGRELDHGLYRGTVLEDDRISRSGAMIWEGGGSIRPASPMRVIRWTPDNLLPGATRGSDGQIMPTESLSAGASAVLRVGDLLDLGPGTRLRATL